VAEHDLTLSQTFDGWDTTECSCGWVSPPCPGHDEAMAFGVEHVKEADHRCRCLRPDCLDCEEELSG
jgi:hypothetical protein